MAAGGRELADMLKESGEALLSILGAPASRLPYPCRGMLPLISICKRARRSPLGEVGLQSPPAWQSPAGLSSAGLHGTPQARPNLLRSCTTAPADSASCDQDATKVPVPPSQHAVECRGSPVPARFFKAVACSQELE